MFDLIGSFFVDVLSYIGSSMLFYGLVWIFVLFCLFGFVFRLIRG